MHHLKQRSAAFLQRVRHSLVWRTIRFTQHQPEWWQVPPVMPAMPTMVQQALKLATHSLAELTPTTVLQQEVAWHTPSTLPSTRDLFALNGEMLPCWQESDVGLYDDWLTDPTYYGYYGQVFQQAVHQFAAPRMLEIGVRTGYMAVVFAKALDSAGTYVGIDPNQYVRNGLTLASESLRRVRSHLPAFAYTLFEGYSWDHAIQRSVAYSGPYHLIHIDGDHSLEGKVLDLHLARQWRVRDGWILVDDYDHHPPIKDALQRAFALGWFNEFAYVPTKRGLAIIR